LTLNNKKRKKKAYLQMDIIIGIGVVGKVRKRGGVLGGAVT